MIPNEPLYTPAFVAEKLSVSTQMVYNKIHSNEWECVRISERTYRFTEQQVKDILNGTNRMPRKTNKQRFREALKKIS